MLQLPGTERRQPAAPRDRRSSQHTLSSTDDTISSSSGGGDHPHNSDKLVMADLERQPRTAVSFAFQSVQSVVSATSELARRVADAQREWESRKTEDEMADELVYVRSCVFSISLLDFQCIFVLFQLFRAVVSSLFIFSDIFVRLRFHFCREVHRMNNLEKAAHATEERMRALLSSVPKPDAPSMKVRALSLSLIYLCCVFMSALSHRYSGALPRPL